MPDEQIVIEITIEDQQAVETAKKIREAINEIKPAIKSVAEQAKVSFREAATAMVEVFTKGKIQEYWNKGLLFGSKEDIAANLANMKSEIADYRLVATSAAKELTTVRQDLSKQEAQSATLARKEELTIEKQIQTQLSAIRRQGVAEADQLAKQRAAAEKQVALQIISNEKQITNERQRQRGTFRAIINEYNALNQGLPTVAEGQRKIATEIKNVGQEANKSIPIWKRLGQAMQVAFGLGIYQGFRQFISSIKDAIKTGEEFAISIYKLSASIHALQRSGVDVTVAGTVKLIKELRQEYGVFTTKDVLAGVANMQLLTRSFALTTDQTKKLLEISADLAIIQGKDMQEGARELALFISSGYGEALQRAGIAVNRLAVVQEAWAMGVKKSYMAMTEQERAMAAVNLLMKHYNDLHEDAAKFQESEIGQITKARAAIDEYKNALGLMLVKFEMVFLKAAVTFVKFIIGFVGGIQKITVPIGEKLIPVLRLLGEVIDAAFSGKKLSGAEIHKRFAELQKEAKDLADQFSVTFDLDAYLKGVKDLELRQKLAEGAEAEADRLEEISLDLRDRILEIQEDGNQEMIDAENDFKDEMNDIDEELLEENADAWEDYYDAIAEIQKDYEKDISDAEEKYREGLEDLNQETNEDIADANREHRDNDEKAERDHLERLRRLREEYLFDLEDALRERDALQVLRLMRRYNLDVEQENRDWENRQKEEEEKHKQEIAEIRRKAEEKREELWEAYQEELADAQEAAEEKRADAEESRDEALADARKAAEEARAEAIENYNKELEDMKVAFEQKKAELLREWAETNNVTTEEAQLIAKVLDKYFGKTGVADEVFDFFEERMNDVVIQMQEDIGLLESLLGEAMSIANQTASASSSSGFPVASPNPTYHASGGSLLLTRPHLFVAGEIPERVDITPLNQINSQKSMGMAGQATMRILLSEGLKAEIIDSSLDQVNLVFEREMSKS